MPYSRVDLPYLGYTDSLPFRQAAQGYTSDCDNVLPYDSFDNRKRLGTRPGFIQIANAGAKVQGSVATESFVQTGGTTAVLRRRFVYCVGGAFYVTDLSGDPVSVKQVARETDSSGVVTNPFNAGYVRNSVASSDHPLNAGRTDFAKAEASAVERSPDLNVADVVLNTTADVEMVAFRHAGLRDESSVATTSGTALSIPTAEPHDYVYATDGDKYVKIDMSSEVPEVSQWIGPYSTVKGVKFGNTNFASLIAKFNSRLALSGVKSNPTNFFLSAINDPYDWIPSSGSTVSVDALAGSSGTKFGEIGDNIKALIPVGSSGLLFGCQNSMSILTNDPVFSDAQIRQVSRSVGCLGPRAFTKVGEMGVLIASSQGVFGIDPNTFDIERGSRLTRDKLDRLFAQTDFEDTNVVMGYDDSRSLAFLCITRTDDSTASRIYAYNLDTGGWWPWRIEASTMRAVNNIVPFQPVNGTRSTPWFSTDSGVILTIPEQVVRSTDGSILESTSFTSTHAPTAAAVNITSQLQVGPINGDPSRRVLLKEVRCILGDQVERDSSGNILTPDTTNGPFLEVLHGDTAQEAVGYITGFKVVKSNSVTLDAKTDSAFEGVSTIDGGSDAAPTTSGTKIFLWGGFAESVDGTYTPATGDTLLNDTTFTGPGLWVFKRNSDGKWEFTHGDALYGVQAADSDWYITTSAVDGLPTTVDINTKLFGSTSNVEATLSSTSFPTRTVSDKKALSRGRDSANRYRIRASDLFLSINGVGRSFAIEDISVDVEDGGPFRSSVQ
tara:strand:- start:60 stop:2396 length:2337 start_codon:yes stop_codon:yes gene_type:complete